MNVLNCLVDALLDTAHSKPAFLLKAQTMLRRSLKLPHIISKQHQFPIDALAVCVFAHLSETPLEVVNAACTPLMFTDHRLAEHSTEKRLESLRRVWEHAWEPVAPRVQISQQTYTTDSENPHAIFRHFYIYLVPSLFFTKRVASLLLEKLKLKGGDGSLVAHGEKGVAHVAESVKRSGANKRQMVLCSDVNILTRYSHLCHISCVPHKWLSDSIRDERVKSIRAYTRTPNVHASPITPNEQNGKRSFADFTTGLGAVEQEAVKRLKQSTATKPNSPNISGMANIRKQLFSNWQTPFEIASMSRQVKPIPKRIRSHTPLMWACEVRTSFEGSEFPMNDKICELLGVVQESYSIKKDHFRATGYQKAVAKIRSLQYEVVTLDDVSRVGDENAIGMRIARKIEEIIKTGRLLQAEAVLENEENCAARGFCDVWGIGPVKAMHLVTRGIRSIAQLREEVKTDSSLLDRNQKIGLALYEDLLCRIPRNEVAELEMYVRGVVKQIDHRLDITVAGSYIRGKSSCGDVDIMIHGDSRRVGDGFPKIKAAMRDKGVLTHDLVDGPDKYFGVFKFPGRKHGRIDLFAVPEEEYPYALLTYTGSAIFNRSMRAKARALGYSLCHRGLRRVQRTRHRKMELGEPIIARNEKEIFFLLDIPYVPPKARSVA